MQTSQSIDNTTHSNKKLELSRRFCRPLEDNTERLVHAKLECAKETAFCVHISERSLSELMADMSASFLKRAVYNNDVVIVVVIFIVIIIFSHLYHAVVSVTRRGQTTARGRLWTGQG